MGGSAGLAPSPFLVLWGKATGYMYKCPAEIENAPAHKSMVMNGWPFSYKLDEISLSRYCCGVLTFIWPPFWRILSNGKEIDVFQPLPPLVINRKITSFTPAEDSDRHKYGTSRLVWH